MKYLIMMSLVFFMLRAEEQPYSFQFQWYPQAQFAGYIIAKEKGIYEKYDINVILKFYDGKRGVLEQLVSGDRNFGTAWLSQAIKNFDDYGLVNVAQIMQKSTLILVAKNESGIIKPEDMNGKRISIWGGDFSIQPNAFFRKYNIKAEIVSQSYSIDILLSGAVDIASAMYYNEYHKLYQAGLNTEEIKTFFFSDYGLNFPEDGIYCTADFYDSNYNDVTRLVKASLEGWKYAFDNKEETLDIIMDYCNKYMIRTNKAHQRWMLDVMESSIKYKLTDNVNSWGKLLKEDFSIVVEELKSQNEIKKVPNFNSFYRGVKNER